jgi:glycerol-3-phosphate dehydrogenase
MPDKRKAIWARMGEPWDVIVIGGGITGVGILHEAAAMGLRALLFEKRDFSFGTSSRSGKFVHGGIRYMRNHQFRVSYTSVKERENLIRHMPGLVTRQIVNYLCLESDRVSPWRLGADLVAYELFAGRLGVQYLPSPELVEDIQCLEGSPVKGAYRYSEGLTDDSRLVLRVLEESERLGGVALNYAAVISLLRQRNGRVVGVVVRDESPAELGRTVEVMSRVVINASGYHADTIRDWIGGAPMIRKSRGSHLIFPLERFPISDAMCYYHPVDQRIQIVVPWQGVLLVGTTDLDYDTKEEQEFGEPAIRSEEVDYILKGLNYSFPQAHLGIEDIQSTFCGVRPLVHGGASNPSNESRRHVLWDEEGLITITGGKLTTFRLMAHDALRLACRHLDDRRIDPVVPEWPTPDLEPGRDIEAVDWSWLVGRYGITACEVAQCAHTGELKPIDGTTTLWAEVRWVARSGRVIHLDDLMLRHTRLGLTLAGGGLPIMEKIRSIASMELGWDQTRWDCELTNYRNFWQACYYLPN